MKCTQLYKVIYFQPNSIGGDYFKRALVLPRYFSTFQENIISLQLTNLSEDNLSEESSQREELFGINPMK